MCASILLVDDDEDILNINSVYLQREGYHCLKAATAEQAYAVIELENPDLIVLDILLGDGSGMEICRNIREFTVAPIIFLTSLLGDSMKVDALRIGGDDYMTKPYRLSELSARIHANLRRVWMHEKKVYHYPPLRIDVSAFRVYLNEQEAVLTQKETQLLIMLVKHAGTAVTSEDLLANVWGNLPKSDSNIRTLHVHISTLRKKLLMDDESPIAIKTVRNTGYCFKYEGE